MRIERARPEDTDAIAALERRCFSDPWPAAVIGRRIGRFLAARSSDGALTGYLCLSHVLDEGSIDNVAVAPECRRQGTADALLDAALAEAGTLGLSFITLEVRASNAPAIALYEKHGYARVGVRPGYYEAPREDAILMTRFL